MKRIAGIGALLLGIMVLTAIIDVRFLSPYNLGNVMRWTGLFGLLSLGTAFVIITGGIDLSTGAIVGLAGSISAYLMTRAGVSVALTLMLIVALCLVLGFLHGLLITKIHVQPFVVTLCGLFIYRGMSRFLMNDRTQGYGMGFQGIRQLASGQIPFFGGFSIPMPFVILIVLGLMLSVVLNKTVYGRHLVALGRNEPAARFSGIHTDRVTITAYVVSATFAGFAGILFSFDLNTVQPSTMGQMYELYAIAGCVVGGVSLRGGEGTITGVIIGAAIVRVLYNSINIAGVATQLEFAVLGLVILAGVTADEGVRLIASRRRIVESVSATDSAEAASE